MGWIDVTFRAISGRQDRNAPGLPEEIAEAAPRNFLLYVVSHVLTKLGDALSNPKTTLAWLAGTLGVPGWMTGLLVPLRESGSMIVQLWLADFVQQFRHRKFAWVAGSVLQALSLSGMALVALFWRGPMAGVGLLALLAMFALARSLSSVASKDVLGRTQPRGRRGQANGWAASMAGIVTLLVAAAALLFAPAGFAAGAYAALLAGAAGLWLLAAGLFSAIREPVGEASAHGSGARLRLLWQDRVLRRFVVARALLMCTALSAPFYVMLTQRVQGEAPRLLAAFIAAQGMAALLGGPFWGRLADRSSRRSMMIGGVMGALLGIAVAVIHAWRPPWIAWPGMMPLAYFLLSLAHQAVRIGRKTYVIDVAGDDRRTDYVSTSNSVIGALLLVVGGAVAALASWSLVVAILALALMGGAGAWATLALPEAAD